ncbi:MAG: type IV toxin-antitoxin system AbiEi family antitoxin domain-containing protein [Chloroflexi bacterium]|nr:type IV toxin-antitoxin system AbiEi family antitoxin domain-containing protein [Chloroflexota bacterium]
MATLKGTTHARELAARSGMSPRRAFNLLSELVQRGEARRVSKGVYAPGPHTRRVLSPTSAMKRLARAIAQEMPALEPVLFSTGQVADLMHNAPAREIVVVATARAFARDLVRALSAAGSNAQVVSTRADMERLLDLPGQVIVAVSPIGDRRASKLSLGVRVALPERVLVDLAIGRDRLGLPLYDEDILALGENVLANYDFSISRALDYARRRRGYDEVAELLKAIVRDPRLHAYAAALP